MGLIGCRMDGSSRRGRGVRKLGRMQEWASQLAPLGGADGLDGVGSVIGGTTVSILVSRAFMISHDGPYKV